ncbi:phosphatidylserine decarboxylase [Anaerobacillus isosaccharinicus]|uniref:phosphatidylserine decarboxylase n=1 Tax=Anaerobacillus isosaccharinicus TaxID=1532552 RepID=A0A1S2LRU3_9BACI|nr:phosphatidylserine decarboxylase [Anaerobacillus isosaccharinicus]MBA5585448.1 phosphatidylserine decarboxylase [Anaerobacillus isosaccharinicus]QOY36234.1 phosphatidylserine decarboxylase [Anaerobacillus isosaccharinicus]
MKKAIYQSFVELSGNRFNSYLLKAFTESKMSKVINKSFVKVYNLNEAEMEKPLHQYGSLQELFVRNLKSDARVIDKSLDSIVSPVDGILADVGQITENCTFHVKNQDYSLVEMLGNKNRAEKYKEGTYIILYLSPSHYHRIHTPVSGTVVGKWALGNKSYPVNELGLKLGKRPLSRNYRLITEVRLNNGKHYSLVKVGAMNVNSIHPTFTGDTVNKGDEIGYFSFGSTVVLLFEKDTIDLDPKVKIPMDVQVGMKIGSF